MLAQRPQAVSETYAAFYDRLSATRLRPGLAARFTARVRWSSLDQQLVAGADPSGSPQLAARATVLTSAFERERLAEAIDRVVDAAHGPQRRWWAVSGRRPVCANAEELRALAQLLRSSRPLYARGVAIVNQLITDGCGPLYTAGAEGLAWALYEALGALLG